MRGELLPVWPDMRAHLWTKLARRAKDHPDIYCELYRELNKVLTLPRTIEVLADITDDSEQAKRTFRSVKSGEIRDERSLVSFLEAAHEVADDLGGDTLSNTYFLLLGDFLNRFSLRYELRRPCHLCPTLPGMFAKLMTELKALASADAHINVLLQDFESAIRDLQLDRTETRLKACIQREMNLLEALGRQCPGVTTNTLGRICGQVRTWPHDKLREAMQCVYDFTNDYPGIRHGGTPAHAIRPIELRYLVAIAIVAAGMSPYVTNGFDAELVYL